MGLAGAAFGLQAAGAVSGGIGAYYSAKAQKTQLGLDAQLDEINAGLAEKNAQITLRNGQREEENSRLKTAQLKSSQKVALAANGVDLAEGTSANLLTSTDVMGEVDANTIASNAVASAWGYRTQATNLENSARMKRATANSISPGMSAATSLLGSAGNVASSYYMLNKTGAK